MSITLHHVDGNLERVLARNAAACGQSVEDYVVGLLREAVNKLDDGEPIGHRLDRFIGMWSHEEAEEFNRNLAEQRHSADPVYTAARPRPAREAGR